MSEQTDVQKTDASVPWRRQLVEIDVDDPVVSVGGVQIPVSPSLRGTGPVAVFADTIEGKDGDAVVQIVIGPKDQLPLKVLAQKRSILSLAEITLRERRRQQWVGVAKNSYTQEALTDDVFDSWWECPIDDEAAHEMDSWYVADPDDTIYPRR